MRVPTALCFLCCAMALAAATRQTGRSGLLCQLFGAAVVLAASLSMLRYVGQLWTVPGLGWLNHPSLRGLTNAGVAMAPLTALSFLGFGSAFILLGLGGARNEALAHGILLPVSLAGYSILVSHLLCTNRLHTWMGVPVAFNTGLAWCVLSAGIFHVRPGSWFVRVLVGEEAGGIIARRLLPAVMVLPVLFGALRFAAARSAFDTPAVDTLEVIANASVLFSVMWLIARSTNRLDAERRRISLDLRQQREWLRVTLSSIGDAVIASDTRGRITFLNPAAVKLTGWTENEALGEQVLTVCPSIDRHTLEAVDLSRLAPTDGPAGPRDRLLLSRDGRKTPIEDSASPIQEPGGEVVGVVVVFHDATAKQQALEMADQSRLVLEAAQLGTWDHRFDTGAVVWDRRCREMFGLPPLDEIFYGAVIEAMHPADRGRIDQAVKNALGGQDGGAYHQDFRVVWADTAEHWIDSHGQVTFEGEGAHRRAVRFAGVNLDITARKRAEERIRQQNTLLRSMNHLFEMASSAATEQDLGRVCVSAAQQMTQSSFGLLNEIGSGGLPHTIAICGPGGDLAKLNARQWTPPTFLTEENGFLTNDPGLHPDLLQLPEGYPPLNAFLGVPLVRGGHTVGMFAVGNRPGGYSTLDLEAVQALAPVVEHAFREKRTAWALRESEAQFRTLANAIPNLCWVANADGWIFWYNDRWYQYTGTTPAQVEGWGWQSVHDPEVLPRVIERWKASLAGGEPFEMVFPLRSAGGEFRPFLTRVVPLRDRDGDIVRWFGTNTDVGDQVQAEAQARKGKELLELFVKQAPVGLAMLDRNLRFIRVSDRWLLDTGLKGQSIVGEPYCDVFPNLPRRWKDAHVRGLAGDSSKGEEDWVARDGETHSICWEIHPWGDSGAETGGIIVSLDDITSRKRQERALRDSEERFRTSLEQRVEERTRQLRETEERYRTLVENVKEYAILMLDPQGLIVSWTPAAERIKGYKAGEIVGKSFACFYTDDDIKRGHPASVLEAAGLNGHFEDEGWRVRKDGSRFWANVMITAVRGESGEIRGFSKMTRDISERRRIEQQLQEREEQFRVLLDCAPDAIVIVDEEAKLAVVNGQAEKLFGYTRQELIGQPVETLIPASARGNHAQYRSNYAGAPRIRQRGGGMELKGLRKSGEEFPVEVSLSPIQTSQGAWVAAGVRDITDRKIAEERLIAERQRAEEANRTKSAFLAAMSHEIRTPMNVILGMSDLLWESELSAEQKEFVSLFRRAGSNLLTLIDDILDFSKIESGHFELEHVEFDLEETVDQAVELIGVKARLKNLSLMSRISPGVATSLVGDPTRLRQILINLLGNAVKFTALGHVVLNIRNAPSGPPGSLEIRVSDTGIGIPPDQAGTIFGDFTQADSSITRTYGGSGLGLAISRRLVHRMGGELTVSSVVGKGSTFSFTVQFELAARQARRTAASLGDIRGRRVMIVDSDPVNCLILREALSSWGLYSGTFDRPESALDELSRTHLAGTGSYSLIILDKRLPGTDGFELSEKIRALTPNIPILMLSPEATPGDVTRGSKAGLAGYAVKPVKRADLLRLVCQAMDVAPPRESQPTGKVCGEVPDFKGPALRILIAEDSPDNRQLVQAYLKGSRHTIAFAEDGIAAVAEFSKSKFNLVLMDLQMPRMDGLTAAQTIRRMEAEQGLPPVPIVALSANARPEDVALSRKSGCDAHLSKPISKAKLIEAIEDYAAKLPAGPRDGQIRIHAPEGLEDLAAQYVSARKAEAPLLIELLAASEFDRIRVAGHNMKGTGTSYGLPFLTQIGKEIESAAQAADAQALNSGLLQLARYLDCVCMEPAGS